MHAVNLIAPHAPAADPLPEEPAINICAVTGKEALCVPRKHLLGKSFTNIDLLRAPNSQWVSADAYRALKYDFERKSSWICDKKSFRRLNRQQVRDIVISADYPDIWSGYVTTSYKKHGALWAPVNGPGRAVWRFEGAYVDCSNHTLLLSVWERLNKELRDGVSRPVMETLVPNSYTIKAVGMHHWLEFEGWASRLFRSQLYKFLCYLLPSQEELKEEQNAGKK